MTLRVGLGWRKDHQRLGWVGVDRGCLAEVEGGRMSLDRRLCRGRERQAEEREKGGRERREEKRKKKKKRRKRRKETEKVKKKVFEFCTSLGFSKRNLIFTYFKLYF